MTNEPMNTALAVWGDRRDVRELDTRLATMLPGADKLSTNQRLALAQGSLAHGLDPFNGEIWMIPGRGLMIGVKGLRKKAREQVQGNFWVEFVEITDADTRRRQRIPDGALAYEARLFDSENLRTYTATCEQLLKAGIPWDAVSRMVGTKPYTTGIGVLAAGEQTKMQPAQCAMKRAEADALKRRFDVPFGLAVEADSDPAENGQWIENVPAAVQPAAERTPEEQAKQDAGIATLYEEPAEAPAAPVTTSKVWKRWNELAAEAEAIGLGAPAMDLAADEADIIAAGKRLAGRIKAYKAQQAEGLPA